MQNSQSDFTYDVYVAYAENTIDEDYVWEFLVPRLTKDGLRVAVAHHAETPGVTQITSIGEIVQNVKRVLILLSPRYLRDPIASFTDELTRTLDIQRGTYRLLPLVIARMAEADIPPHLGMLEPIYFTNPHRAEREVSRLIDALKGPLPKRERGTDNSA